MVQLMRRPFCTLVAAEACRVQTGVPDDFTTVYLGSLTSIWRSATL